MEEDTAPPRRNDTFLLGSMRATRSSFMRFTEPQGRTEEPPVPPRRSTSIHSGVFRIWLHHLVVRGGGETLSSREEACGKRWFWRSRSQLIGFWHRHLIIICWGTLDRWNYPMGCQQIPTGNLPWKFW
jgi:hypothetical protein